jgi:hypothetical protein
VETLIKIDPYEDRVIPMSALAKRWNCHPASALRRVKNFGVPILKFNGRAHGVKLSDILNLEQEASE